MSNATTRMTNAAHDGADAARDAAHEAFSGAKESFGEARDAMQKAARETIKDAGAYGRRGAAKAYDAAQTGARSVADYVNEKPVQAALIGLGGLLLASLLLRRR